jgi:proprotein convertase subtilisin/kexin type 5
VVNNGNANVSLYGYPVAQVCVDICPDPYYSNITDHLCYKCPEECASCYYPQLCLTCVANHYLYSGACVESCPTFPVITYANPNRICGAAYQCTQGYYALNSTKSCVTSCPAGFYVNIASQTCDSCMKGCSYCLNGAQCITCNSNLSIWSNYKCYVFCSARNRFYGTTGCVAQCPNGTYLNITTCQSCSSTCKTCIVTAQNCLVCANGLYISNGICVSTCPTNTSPQNVNNSQTCVSCNGPCTQQPLTFTTTQFTENMKYTVQMKFNGPVTTKAQLDSIFKASQKKTTRLLATSS